MTEILHSKQWHAGHRSHHILLGCHGEQQDEKDRKSRKDSIGGHGFEIRRKFKTCFGDEINKLVISLIYVQLQII